MDEQISKWYADKAKVCEALVNTIQVVRGIQALDVAYAKAYDVIINKLETRLEHARYMGD